jgi:dTDP-4-dehydrorhamnose reductase
MAVAGASPSVAPGSEVRKGQQRTKTLSVRTAVIGATGQLGTDIIRTWPDGETVGLAHSSIEVTNREQVLEVLRSHAPELVVNCAAFHNVDACETEPERAFAVNALGTMNVADACQALGAALVFISTDYVFAGDLGRPYAEWEPPRPINVYGVSKLAGEQLIRSRLERHYIVRTSGLYGTAGSSGKGGNFVERMLQLARAGENIRVVEDQVLSPTLTYDLAQKLRELVETGHFGTYHVTNSGSCSWHDFAAKAFELTGTQASLARTTTKEFAAKAGRPSYSVLANAALQEVGLEPLRPWTEALADYLHMKGHLPATDAP